MTILDIFYCNQYYELVKSGKDGNKALRNGLILTSACLTLNILTVFFILFNSKLAEYTWLITLGAFIRGKALGEVSALILVTVIYIILRYRAGDEEYFQQVISKYKIMSDADKKSINRKAYIYCLGSIFILIVCAFL